MSAINPSDNLFNIAPSPQDLVDEDLASDVLGAGVGTASAGSASAEEEPPQELALDTLNEFTQAAQRHFNTELYEENVPADIVNAQDMTSQLVGGITASATEALAAAAQKLQPSAVLALLS